MASNNLSGIILNKKLWVSLDSGNNTAQKTRIIRMGSSYLLSKLEISRKRRFEIITNLMTLEELTNCVIKSVAGIATLPELKRFNSFMESFESVTQHMYSIVIGTEFIAAS